MMYVAKETLLTTELLKKMIGRFNLENVPKLNKYKNYYDGIQAILNKRYSDASKPCNKTVINYCKNIVDSYCGYLATPSHISYSSKEDIEELMDILRYNDYQAEDADFLLNALVYGTAAELMYLDTNSQTRFRLINPAQCFGVYDDSLTGDLLYFVRFYKASEWDDSDTYKVDVYSDKTITHYTMKGTNGEPEFISEEPHYFS
jgi:SPP1 family phage portal protein